MDGYPTAVLEDSDSPVTATRIRTDVTPNHFVKLGARKLRVWPPITPIHGCHGVKRRPRAALQGLLGIIQPNLCQRADTVRVLPGDKIGRAAPLNIEIGLVANLRPHNSLFGVLAHLIEQVAIQAIRELVSHLIAHDGLEAMIAQVEYPAEDRAVASIVGSGAIALLVPLDA